MISPAKSGSSKYIFCPNWYTTHSLAGTLPMIGTPLMFAVPATLSLKDVMYKGSVRYVWMSDGIMFSAVKLYDAATAGSAGCEVVLSCSRTM